MTKQEFLIQYSTLIEQQQDLLNAFVESLPDETTEDGAEIIVAKEFCLVAGIQDQTKYLDLIRRGVTDGWYPKIKVLYFPSIVTVPDKKLFNAVDPADQDYAYRGTFTKGILISTHEGISIRAGLLDEITTHLPVDAIPGYPFIGFGANIKQSNGIITQSAAGFIPTLDQYGKSYLRICTEQHEKTLPVEHRKPKGNIFAQHSKVKKSADLWHEGQLVFSDPANTATGSGEVKIIGGPQYDNPTNYYVLSYYMLYEAMEDELLKKMMTAFKEYE